MASPVQDLPKFEFQPATTRHSSSEDKTVTNSEVPDRPDHSVDSKALRDRLKLETQKDGSSRFDARALSPSKVREEQSRIDDELMVMKAERVFSTASKLSADQGDSTQLRRSRSRAVQEPVDQFDAATNPVHERTAIYKPPENPSTKVAIFFKYIHESSFIVRYFVYIIPVFILLLIPVLIGAFVPAGQGANVGGVNLMWFGVWLEIFWLTLWAGRILARMIPWPLGLLSSLFTNNSKKWRDLGKQLEIPATIFFWWLAVEISFLPTMTNHHVDGNTATKSWEVTMNKIIIAVFVGATLNFVEKLIIQLIAISFHLRTYSDRIELNKFQIGSLTKLYIFSKAKIAMEDAEFENPSNYPSGTRTPAIYAEKAQAAIGKAFAKAGDVAGTVAGDFTGKKVAKSSHPSQVVLSLLNTTAGSQVLARRLYRTFVRDGEETVSSEDLKAAFDNNDEADAAFSMFDKDMNGDISMEELEAVCVEIGRERKSIMASLKDLDSVVSKLNDVLFFVVVVVTILVLISLLSTSAAGVLTSAGSAVLALSWLFAATAQEFLQSCIFVFVKHPFDVGDRVAIYGNTGAQMKGDDYFVKEISLLYTEFKKMEGHIVQAPNSYLNTLFILNQRRSGGLAEAVPIVIRFGTTLEQIDGLREALLGFVTSEKREFQGKILTELREVTEAYSLTLNIVFFYKSNWQNELLRLQRRNKFICAMMVAMQELGIEGPRRNNAGWREDVPYYMQAPAGAPPPPFSSSFPSPDQGTQPPRRSNSNEDVIIESPVLQSSRFVPPSSILRQRAPSTGQLGRTRAESLSQMAKRVDFSLGMKDVSSGDSFGDVYEPSGPTRHEQSVMRQANIAEEQRRASEASSLGELARATSRDHSSLSGGLLRRPTTRSFSQHRDSHSSQETHRNRFLNRLGHHPSRSLELTRESLAEEGHAPPIDLGNSSYVSTQAMRMGSVSTAEVDQAQSSTAAGVVPTGSRTEDFEMRRFRTGSSGQQRMK